MRRVTLGLVLLAVPAALWAQPTVAFPHARHAGLFPTCSTCHAGIPTGEAARAFPAAAACTACHDGTVRARVAWTPPVRPGPGLLVFTHPAHLNAAGDVACEDCHALAGPAQRMNVGRATQARCTSCHEPSTHFADNNVCATCHRPLTGATALTDARVAALPKPPSHGRADFVSTHGAAARANTPNCSTCHARETCLRCHVNGASVPPIRALGTDARVARLTAGKAPVYPTPADHRTDAFAAAHGTAARTNAARCATCHTRASCETCHTGTGARDVLRGLPSGRDATAPGVQLYRSTRSDTASHRVSVHPVGWARTHRGTASTGDPSCANCHAQRFCADCHGGERVTRKFHPANFVSIHAPQAYGRDVQCSSCHSTEAFCRDCHRQSGLAAKSNARSTVFHNAVPLWLLTHGRAARQDLPSCTTCHQQTYCMQCHSDLGSRINPHGPGFNAAAMSNRNARICLACHFRNPLAVR